MEKLTLDTFGLPSERPSRSAALQSSLASRLRALLARTGCPLYGLTWKTLAMKSGSAICALRASVPRTSGNASTGWPTVTTMPKDWSPEAVERYAADGRTGQHGLDLGGACLMAGWGTPTSRDWKDGVSVAGVPVNGLLGRQVVGAGWSSPRATYRGALTVERALERRRGGRSEPSGHGRTGGGLGDPDDRVPALEGPHGRAGSEAREEVEAGLPSIILVPCLDGKARPIEPGVLPVAHRLPADVGWDGPGEASPFRVIRDPETGRSIGQSPWRIGMIRAYGNAIVPQVAAIFITAFMEAISERVTR